MDASQQDGLIRVRATVNLPGLAHGTEALVDPKDPYIKSLLKSTMIIRVRSRARRPAATQTVSAEPTSSLELVAPETLADASRVNAASLEAATGVSGPELGRPDEH